MGLDALVGNTGKTRLMSVGHTVDLQYSVEQL